MATISDPHKKHDWSSEDYVARWAKRQDGREEERKKVFRLLADTIPYGKEVPIQILDLGAGYGGLAQSLLRHFPNAIAVCQDGSEEMAALGQKRMVEFKGRFSYLLSDLSRQGWSSTINEQFEAVVSSIAIHNLRQPDIIREVYKEIFLLVKPGGCFLNFDRTVPSLEELVLWVREAGFEDVKCFWKEEKRALFGGFKIKVAE